MNGQSNIETNSGYSELHPSDYDAVVGRPQTEGSPELLDKILNGNCKKVRTIANWAQNLMLDQYVHDSNPLTTIEADQPTVRSVISGIAATAMGCGFRLESVSYIDMNQAVSSEDSLEQTSRDIERFARHNDDVPFKLLLVNASNAPEPDQIDRARQIDAELRALPGETFKVGFIASPQYAEVVHYEATNLPATVEQSVQKEPVVHERTLVAA